MRRAWLWSVLVLGLSGCVQQAVLENDIRSAVWKARTLSTASDTNLARSALSAQLVELEALYQRSPGDARVRQLLDHGYLLLARGFIELDRLDAAQSGDSARATQAEQARSDAEARARYYRGHDAKGASSLDSALAEPQAACLRHDRAAYDRGLSALLQLPERGPEARLERVLVRRLAAAWLQPNVAARCGFTATPR